MRWFLFLLLATVSAARAQSVQLSEAQAMEIGRRIWKNECGGTVSGLTAWNSGEDFASLGIAHFIWYPEGKRGPFEESFPKLVDYLTAHGVHVPGWLAGACPWKSRAQFMADFQTPRMVELRTLLKDTLGWQARFAAVRLERALPKMLAAAPSAERPKVSDNFYRVAGEPLGLYALMDYVNFKGEGVSPTERYRGEGWGLLQVLEAMPERGPPLPQFVKAADHVLTRRVENAPPGRGEAKWLPGWRNRLKTYLN
ncbi:MAG TPA: hypothetical protein VFS35_09685 [Terrimicrobiaceae bacterium]|nr:hypothetical protein [Terrimicrobiaceae bacterium]